MEIFELDARYSTTRHVTRTPPGATTSAGNDGHIPNLFAAAGHPCHGGLRTRGYFKSGMPNSPLVTVITVVFNGVETLEKTIKSVIEQNYDNVEYVVIDGGSTDGSLDLIQRYEHAIDYWVSERDAGIYDAMNKGATLTTGKWVNFMNGGDAFHGHDAVTRIFKSEIPNSAELIYGGCLIRYQNGVNKLRPAGDLKNLNRGMVFSHQSLFTSGELLQSMPFRNDCGTAADFAFIYSAYKRGHEFHAVDVLVSIVSVGGVSDKQRIKSLINTRKAVREFGLTSLGEAFFLMRLFSEQVKGLMRK